MAGKIRNVAIITKINNNEAEKAANKIADLLKSRSINTYTIVPLEVESGKSVNSAEIHDLDLDLAFAVGGDGTTLRAFRIVSYNVPVFSMNVGGNRGILSEIGIESIEKAINTLLEGRYFYDTRIRIQISLNGKILSTALNDVLFTRTNLTRTPFISIRFMGDEINQRMDGVIISTPTGSTGHSFSFGGPVLHEGMDCMIISPIASVNRMPRLVIPSEQIELNCNYDANLIIDGQESFKVLSGQNVKISKYPYDAVFLRLQKKGMRQLAKLGF